MKILLIVLFLFGGLCAYCQSIISNISGVTCANTPITFTVVNDTLIDLPITVVDSSSVVLGDDIFSTPIPIGFNFEFFGIPYSDLLIASNNFISFQLTSSGAPTAWNIANPIPNPLNPLNAIMLPWQDVDPSANGKIRWATIGQAPNRVFIVSYDSISMFNCTNLYFSSQVHLYENCNIIETHLLEKPICTAWNGGNAIHGLHNATGTQAAVVPGRNYPNQWIASNDGYRFTPNGSNNYIIDTVPFSFINLDNPTINIINNYQYDWYIDNVYITTGDTVSLTLSQDAVVSAIISNTNTCLFPLVDTIFENIYLSNASFNYPDTIFCASNGLVQLDNFNTLGSFSSNPAGLSLNSATGELNTNTSSIGTYTVYNETTTPCLSKDSVELTIAFNPTSLNYIDTLFCHPLDTIFPIFSPSNNVLFGPSNSIIDTLTGNISLLGLQGNYQVFISSNLQCSDTSYFDFTVSTPPPYFLDSVQNSCLGQNINPNLNNLYSYQWSPNIGISDTLSNNPTIQLYENQTYNVLISEDDGCQTIQTYTIIIDQNCSITFYSGFTPNNDNLNDTWVIDGLPSGNNSVTIFNRWGDVVWETQNYNNSTNVWNGTNQVGNECSVGVYYYIVQIGEDTYEGFIELTR
jgi:gliding motility-associated-like protein